jgi:hypothetical protein
MSKTMLKLVEAERAVHDAAVELEKSAMVVLTLRVWQFDVDKKHKCGTGEMRYTFNWLLPLHGRTELTKSTVVQPEFETYLHTHATEIFDGSISLQVAEAIQALQYGYGNQEPISLVEGRGLPDKKTPDTLTVADLNGKGTWMVKFTYSTKGLTRILESVSLVHDSAEHPQITEFLAYKAVKERELHMRMQYTLAV